ncbi:MAG: 5-methyltetrahydropteroyltriglutamate--homocysteine S-methyltransferase, partial [Bifidobacteriaceae bacterium]|nr:5-methyltetrahydropteroyltriglutamate--homocysteine S-methyltransferase [Bifidobacteriaceae bacterium]
MTHHRAIATVLGYPRQGPRRELKTAVEAYLAGRLNAADLLATARDLRATRLAELRQAGLGEIPSNDFSLYDHILDTAWLLGAIPERFGPAAPAGDETADLDRYFAAARGTAGVEPLEMTKWFDTNYHYLVPELAPDTEFSLNPAKPLQELAEAKAAGLATRPVVVGPISFLLLAKTAPEATAPAGWRPLDLLDRVLPLYTRLLAELRQGGAEWVQLDEPCLVLDQDEDTLARVAEAYRQLGQAADRPSILVATYFDHLGEAWPTLAAAPIEGVAADFTGPAAANLEQLQAIGGLGGKRLVAGLIDGRNIWTADLAKALAQAESLAPLADRLDVAASCSLLHVPLDLRLEQVPAELDGWLAFAHQKLAEIAALARGLAEGADGIAQQLEANR